MHIVTGGAGFIGSAIVWMLNRQGIDDILIVDDLKSDSYKWQNLIGLRFHDIWSREDFPFRLDSDELRDAKSLIHMGACSSTMEEDADYLLDNNYRYSVTLGEWALRRGVRYIYASSASVYGDGSLGFDDDPKLTERLRPLNKYAYSKQLFDLHVIRRGWYKDVVGLRFFNVYGPNEYHKGPMRSMVLKAVEQVRDKGSISLFKSTDQRFGDGDQVRDFLYVKDAVNVIWGLLQDATIGGIFNVGGGEPHTWNELARNVFTAMEREPDIRYFDMPAELIPRYQSYTCAEIARLKSALGDDNVYFRPFQEAVRDYVQAYLLPDPQCHLDSHSSQSL